ncbi:hypothetical protein O3P69_017633 [Scylla paramamosain]|uniref:Uncharacterized protein n=1 Tax=Scylla paramamosain TaxID=85552 RepID=A0AAW0TZW8_SCYPA
MSPALSVPRWECVGILIGAEKATSFLSSYRICVKDAKQGNGCGRNGAHDNPIMNRWSNNYYTQSSSKDRSPRRSRAQPSAPALSRSRRGSLVKTANNGYVNLCVFRVAHLTQLTLKSLIERQGVQVLNIEQVSLRGAGYKSFAVTVKEKDAPKLLGGSFWPGLVSCRPLQDVDPWHNDVFSRRLVREPHRPANHSEKNPHYSRRVSRVGGTQPGREEHKLRTVHAAEEALRRLLGPDFDRLLTQYNLTDEEIFLGVRVLAHCARADGGPKKLQQLVYKICQPQVISLIKEFTRTVEEKHKARAERYFWDLGEFLDLYIVHNIFLQGMLSLFTTCLSKILALNYRKYVSDDLVKVYRGMHTKVFKNLPQGLA